MTSSRSKESSSLSSDSIVIARPHS
jgi:hypothetical protein